MSNRQNELTKLLARFFTTLTPDALAAQASTVHDFCRDFHPVHCSITLTDTPIRQHVYGLADESSITLRAGVYLQLQLNGQNHAGFAQELTVYICQFDRSNAGRSNQIGLIELMHELHLFLAKHKWLALVV